MQSKSPKLLNHNFPEKTGQKTPVLKQNPAVPLKSTKNQTFQRPQDNSVMQSKYLESNPQSQKSKIRTEFLPVRNWTVRHLDLRRRSRIDSRPLTLSNLLHHAFELPLALKLSQLVFEILRNP